MTYICSIRNYKDYLQYIKNWEACSSQEQDQLRKWYRDYYSHNKEAERKRYRDYYASNPEAERERLKKYKSPIRRNKYFTYFRCLGDQDLLKSPFRFQLLHLRPQVPPQTNAS
jgi:hypothetical protein